MTRDKLVNIRLTKEEHAAIEKVAKADQRPVAVFIRLAALALAGLHSPSQRMHKRANKL
jgi:uncharacterized protein (DUF1778 family)